MMQVTSITGVFRPLDQVRPIAAKRNDGRQDYAAVLSSQQSNDNPRLEATRTVPQGEKGKYLDLFT